MANVSDKSILTAAGKALLAQLNAEEKALVIDKMIFANVPNRPEYPQPDDVVPTDNVVYQAAVEQRGRLSEDSVIYSTTLASNEGPFEFNWTGAYCSEYGVLVTIDHHSLMPKTVDEPGVSGNTLVRSVVLEYKDIAEITNITVDASTWQYNATPRMKKMDDDVAQANIDQNGKDWFIEEGFLVTPQASAFSIKAGAGYVSGNRVALEFDRSIQVPNKPSFIYIDAHREGTPTGEQVTLFNFVVSAEEKDDYIDSSTGKDVPHFVCKIAQVLGDGSVSDLRPEGNVATLQYVEKVAGVAWKEGTLVTNPKSVYVFAENSAFPIQLYAPNASINSPVLMGEKPDSNWETHYFRFADLGDMCRNGNKLGIFDGAKAVVENVYFTVGDTDEGEGISIDNTSLFANSLKGGFVHGESFGGVIATEQSMVESAKIYLNLIEGKDKYRSYLYFDAPDMPVSPVAYSDSYGGSVKDGIFAVTDRTGQDVRSFHGYRAGHKSITLNACFFGAQAGEMAQDTLTENWWKGGSAGFGRLALHDSTSANTAAMGNEAANHLKGDRGAYFGSFSGNSAEGKDSCGVGFQSCDHNLGHYVNGVGYQAMFQNHGDYCDGFGFGALGNNRGDRNGGFGPYVLNNSLGSDNFGAGYRTLSVCHGSFNVAGGNQAAFKSDGSPFTASHVALWGYRAGYNSDGNGLAGVGREVLSGSTGDFLSGLGYLAGVGVTYSRSTCIGQQSTVTGNDQIQLGAPGSSVYAYGPVQDRSDERDKTGFNPISDALKNFLLDVEFQTYRLDYRESYFEYEQVQVGVDEEAQPVFETRIKPLPKDGSKAGKRHHAGAVAQQVKVAMDKHGVDFGGYQDHSVNGGEDVKSLGYQEFIPIIGALIQDHDREVKELKAMVSKLSKQVEALQC
ncbi:phage tail protein [Vibrio splendidus]|uniref:phage tail-collar fiber domain-containing protein n=1 Tax=Vibrio splendidus TaxID=29497 RepID=UPI0024686C53|nr:phage tail protein [Vibrio splendidus]MDH6024981.1 phage tail protein [Vibrio splendidus]